MPLKTIAEMWEEHKAKYPGTVSACCEVHSRVDRLLFYSGLIALHRYITSTEFSPVDTGELCDALDLEISQFSKENLEFAMGQLELGSDKVQ